MNVSPQLVHEVINSQGLDRLCVFNMAKTDQLYYKEAGSTAELCKAVDICETSIDGPYYMEVWQGTRGVGRRAPGAKMYSFILAGRSGRSASDPKLDRLCDLVERLVTREDEPEETPVPALALDSPLMALAIKGLEKFLGVTAPPSVPAVAPITGPPGSEMGRDEAMEVLQLIAAFRAANPEQYAATRAMLTAQYGATNGEK